MAMRQRAPDAVVIGGGPAGATAARLLALWGHRVEILTAAPAGRVMAECLPPSTRKVFRFLGIQQAIEAAGFFETTGNTVWWGARGKRVEPYPAGAGYQVDRAAFDAVLLELARSAGAAVRVGRAFAAPGPAVTFEGAAVKARFLVDCSGRAGVLARPLRFRPKDARMVALCGVWRSESGWKLPDATHTLVEQYGEAWAWSVPLSQRVRHVAFMVKPRRGMRLAEAYAAEMAKTRALRKIFAKGALEGAPWGRDASLYSSRRFGGPGFVLAGDAGSFIDPLSSFGVKKAMVSGWAAAVVANTSLRRPEMQDAALRFFDERERAIEEHYRKQAGAWFGEAAETGEAAESHDGAELREALERLKRRRVLQLVRGEGVRVEQRARIEGREVVLRPALLGPGMTEALDYVSNVDLVKLVELAPRYRSVPDLFDAYCRTARVELPDFLRALATAVGKRLLSGI